MTVKSFRICVSDNVLNDLRTRLARTRFTTASDTAFWAAGTDPGYLHDLVTYWANGFDWPAAERALNAYPHYSEIMYTRPDTIAAAPERAADPALEGTSEALFGGAILGQVARGRRADLSRLLVPPVQSW